MSDLTAFFYMGKLVEYDRTDLIFTNPTQKQTEGLYHRPIWLSQTSTDAGVLGTHQDPDSNAEKN